VHVSNERAQGESAGKMFKESKEKLFERPWCVDRLDALLVRFADRSKGPHKKAIVFVDNAGSDVLLGMLPFVRELLQRGTQVVRASKR
jgi:Damage-control phosphatase ARMT1-like domain